MFSSGELGILKPDEAFFIAIEQALGDSSPSDFVDR
jgi:hypothetical protein